MSIHTHFTLCIGCALIGGASLRAEEPAAEIAALEKAAADFVVAYNHQDATTIVELFTEAGEITDMHGNWLTTGRSQIRAHYDEKGKTCTSP